MNVTHVTGSLSRRGGGVSAAVWAMATYQKRFGVTAAVAGLGDGDMAEETAECSEIVRFSGHRTGPVGVGYCRGLSAFLMGQRGLDIVHSHGVWMYPNVAAERAAVRRGVRLVVTPHGMLEPWALGNSRWKKRIWGGLLENRYLEQADCVHVFSAAEYEHVRRYGLRNPVAVIPNGVALETLEGAGAGDQSGDRDRRCVLFLGRLHRKKGVSFLLEAWAGLGEAAREWELVIAGPDSGGYGAKMQGLADRLGIAERVRFVGELAGVEKISALKGADVFVLPSRSEGFSMAVLEAAGCGVPSLITDACHFGELAEAGGAVEVEPNAEGVREGLRYLMGLGEARRREMGEKGRRLVAANYRWEAVCEQMVGVYRWLLGTGQEPRCVRRD